MWTKVCTMFWTWFLWCNMEYHLHLIQTCYTNMLALQYHSIYQSSYCIELVMHFNVFSNAISSDEAEFQEYFTPMSSAAFNYYADLGKSARVWKCTVTPTPHLTQLKSFFYSICLLMWSRVVEQRSDGKITQRLEFI